MSHHVPPTRQHPAPPEPPRRGIEVGLLPFVASIVGILLAAGIIGGVLWATRDGADPVATTHTDPTQPGGALSGRPTLQVEPDGTTLVWTMDFEGLQEGDVFMLSTGPEPDAVTGDPVRVDGTTLKQGVSPGEQRCGMVQVVRGSQRSGWSDVQCERVGQQ